VRFPAWGPDFAGKHALSGTLSSLLGSSTRYCWLEDSLLPTTHAVPTCGPTSVNADSLAGGLPPLCCWLCSAAGWNGDDEPPHRPATFQGKPGTHCHVGAGRPGLREEGGGMGKRAATKSHRLGGAPNHSSALSS
jgi:hypothetical protein